ncbi:MAG: amidohydrolase family protein [Planctomycetaceae bacterium]|nr:amidohydrolase family protein [Planctomycetaceae bacterium]
MSVHTLLQHFQARWVQFESGVVEDGEVVVVQFPRCQPRILGVIDPFSTSKPTTEAMIRTAEKVAAQFGHNAGKFERLPDCCLGDVALLPGMVNCHTHLEFSDCQEPLGRSGLGFAEWLRAIIAHRASGGTAASEERVAMSSTIMGQGWREILAGGVAAAGEILSQPATGSAAPGPKVADFCGTIFHEVLGLAPQRAQASWNWARECLQQSPHENVRHGLSPHAPYSTSTQLYRQCAEFCGRNGVPLATHLAESREELQLLSERTGPLVELFEQMGVWRPEQIEARGVRDVLEVVSDVENLLLIHGNYLEREDWRWLRDKNPNVTIVYCPQTHAYFQHERHPWVEMAADGLSIALGTDSRASSSSLSLWHDVQLVRETYPEQDPLTLWSMATINGAKALGLNKDLGAIGPGKLARFCVADLGTTMTRFSWEALLSSSTQVRSLSGLEL